MKNTFISNFQEMLTHCFPNWHQALWKYFISNFQKYWHIVILIDTKTQISSYYAKICVCLLRKLLKRTIRQWYTNLKLLLKCNFTEILKLNISISIKFIHHMLQDQYWCVTRWHRAEMLQNVIGWLKNQSLQMFIYIVLCRLVYNTYTAMYR